MIFNAPGHIQMIRNGLHFRAVSGFIVKTQTRRLNRGIYKVGKSYAVQRKRGVKAESDIRIVIDRIWKEEITPPYDIRMMDHPYAILSESDAWAEGGYSPIVFERLFRELNPNWKGVTRYGFKFHVVEVLK